MSDWFPGGAEWDECDFKLEHGHHGWGQRKILGIRLIQLEQQQLDALMEFANTRSVSLAVDIVDSIMDDLGISDNRKATNE